MEYTIIRDGENEIDKFVLKDQHIAEGWEPQGGVCITDNRIIQAMIRRGR